MNMTIIRYSLAMACCSRTTACCSRCSAASRASERREEDGFSVDGELPFPARLNFCRSTPSPVGTGCDVGTFNALLGLMLLPIVTSVRV